MLIRCEGTAGIRQAVILYDEVPRIDFVNTVYKNDALAWSRQDEEGFFVFPLRVPDFELRHEMPSGDVKPYVDARHANPGQECEDIEQFYTSSTDFYTVNRWIDASSTSGNYGVTLSSISAPIVQYGERRTLLYDVDYNTQKPWIYSYALNNKWGTNFMRTQPGVLTFHYSLQSHKGTGWRDGRADHFGWEQSVPLLSCELPKGQPGAGLSGETGQWLTVDADNVALTAAKIAEANGEGVILRFNETMGRDTDVVADLSFFHPDRVTMTDLVENDRQPASLENGKVRFSIDAYGYKTLRICFGAAPETVKAASAVIRREGTWISWEDSGEPAGFYEVFREKAENFIPGTGNYIGSTCNEVRSELSDPVAVVTAKGMQKPGNIAPRAAILASSQLGTHTPVSAVADGLYGVTGQWVSAGEKTPWILLKWEDDHCIDKVVFYDRDTGEGIIKKGVFEFSDGSMVETGEVTDGVFGKSVTFPARKVNWMKFRITESKGVNIGLAEIEVYEASTKH